MNRSNTATTTPGFYCEESEASVKDLDPRVNAIKHDSIRSLIASLAAEGLAKLAGTLGQGGKSVGAVEDPAGAT